MAILQVIRHRFYDNNGAPLNGGKVYTYIAGTTTLKATYNSAAGTVANANPIILDAKGEADIWMNGLYKVNVTTSADAQITGYPVDNIGSAYGYDIQGFISGKPTASQVVLYMPMVRVVAFDVNLALSGAVASIAATASSVFSILKNGTQFGTITFGIGGTVGAFSATTATSFAAGDILSVTAPASADATLANIGFNLTGSATP